MKPFLILQLRPIDLASDNEYEAFLNYGQLTKLEVERVRMEKEGIPNIDLSSYSGIILGGGPSNVSDDEHKKFPYQKKFELKLSKLLDKVFEMDFPFLGTCYGMGALVKHRGGIVSTAKYAESVGVVKVNLSKEGREDELTKGVPANFEAYGGHKEACQILPKGATLLASSDICPVQMIRFGANIYATQFHTELDQEGIVLRIDIYKDHGYFSPEDAEKLIRNSKKSIITSPMMILEQFIKKYKRK